MVAAMTWRGLVRLLFRRCDWDCGRPATRTVKSYCGCTSRVCVQHAALIAVIWDGSDRWHCVDCDTYGIGSPIRVVEHR